ncbi:MAG: MASE1 domain-containing protein [Solirubrobacterales bacterium]
MIRLALNVLLVGFICYLSNEIGFAHKFPPHYISPLWPTGAILFSVLVATPARHWWAYILAAYFTSVIHDVSVGFPISAVFFIVAGILEILIAAVAVRRFAEGLHAFDSLRTLAIYTAVAFLAPFTSAFVGASAGTAESYWFYWRVWFLSEAVAFVLLAPAILTWIAAARTALEDVSLARCIEAGLIGGGLLAISVRVFSGPTGEGSIPALVYLPLPLLLLAAVRFGPVGVNTSLLIVAFLSISGAVRGRGPFAATSAADNVLALQLFLITMSIPLMFLATLIAERREKDQATRMLSGRLVNAQEDERRHIARELHDEIGQMLTVVKINLESLREPKHLPGAASGVDACVENVDRAIQQVRELALDLHPAILDHLGLPAALRWFVDRMPQGPTTHLAVEKGEGKTLSPECKTAAFRIAQEAVTNVLRHARARNVWVSLATRPSDLELSVCDDGMGFDLGTVRRSPATSFGLSGMEERVRLVGGRIEIRTSPGAGTEVRASFPVAAP